MSQTGERGQHRTQNTIVGIPHMAQWPEGDGFNGLIPIRWFSGVNYELFKLHTNHHSALEQIKDMSLKYLWIN